MSSLESLPDPELVDVVRAVWFETAAARAALHRLLGVRSCDVEAVVAGTRVGPGRTGALGAHGARLRLAGECLCRDLLVDLLVEADEFLHRRGSGLRNVPAAVRVHLRTRALVEWTRRRRVEAGAQARTDRIRSGARARALPDEFHRALLEYVVAEAGSLAPLRDDDQLHTRLAELVAAEFGGAADDWRARVPAGLRTLEERCRSGPAVSAGPDRPGETVSWWDRYVVEPLGRRPRPDLVMLDALAPDVLALAP